MSPNPPQANLTVCKRSVNKNIVLTLVLCTLAGLADNLWSGTVFVAYLKLLNRSSNAAVGYVEGVQGVSGLLTALPIGWLADVYKRSAVISWGGVLLVAAAAAHTSILFYVGDEVPDDDDKVNTAEYLFLGVMALWGLANGVVNGPVQALYADSTPEGSRTTYYLYLFVCYMLSSCVGPLISIVLFVHWGDDWELLALKNVMVVGMGLELGAAGVMFFFDDDWALKERGEEEDDNASPDDSDDGGKKANDGGGKGEADELLGVDGQERSSSGQERSSSGKVPSEPAAVERRRKWIPYILFCSDLTVSLGSGMTVKFFPVFFKDDCNMSPVNVQVIYLIVPIFMVLASGFASSLSKTAGRIQTILLCKGVGLGLLFSIVFKVDYLKSAPLALVPLYVARTALMNSTYPLQESVLMDFVPKEQRARWKSLESVSQFGWCGSAVLGGILADDYDYTFTFLITAVVQSAGTLLLVLLLPLVPRSEEKLCEERKTESLSRRSASRSDLEEPLLAGEEGGRLTGVV